MKISELRSGQGNVEVEGEISELGDTRAFNKYGRELKVANAILKDDSGAIKLTLWNDDVMRFKEGDRIKIINGYVSELQGEKQLTSGKFGRMEKIGGEASGSGSADAAPAAPAESAPKKPGVSKRDAKKKNEEGLDEYSEENDEEKSENEMPEEELF